MGVTELDILKLVMTVVVTWVGFAVGYRIGHGRGFSEGATWILDELGAPKK